MASVPGGCTVGGAAIVPVPNGGNLVTSAGPLNEATQTVAAIFPSLVRGNYRFDASVASNAPPVTLTIRERSWIILTAGSLPVTPPGSSQ
jgi:hypothetical protein